MTDHKNKAKSAIICLQGPFPSTEFKLCRFKRQLRMFLETVQEIDIILLYRKSELRQVPSRLVTLIKSSFASLTENTFENLNNSATFTNTGRWKIIVMRQWQLRRITQRLQKFIVLLLSSIARNRS